MEVIQNVADRANEELEEMPPLYEVVDPDALEAIFAPRLDGTPRSGAIVVFPYAGYRVKITGDRDVEVEPLEDDT